MNKYLALAATAALAVSVSLSSMAPAAAAPYYYHHYRNYAGAGIAAGILGFMAGAALASSNRGYYRGSDWQAHVADCQATYRSYDVRTDSYLGYDNYRHPCEL